MAHEASRRPRDPVMTRGTLTRAFRSSHESPTECGSAEFPRLLDMRLLDIPQRHALRHRLHQLVRWLASRRRRLAR